MLATPLSLTRVNGGLRFVMFIALLLPLSFANAASFDCAKATTLVEKAICGDPQLSARDDALMTAYQHALVEASDANRLKAEQRAWLKNVRNKCQDETCLYSAYDQRIAALGGKSGSMAKVSRPADPNIVRGRCHMDSCWWWKVASMETVRAEATGRLVKVLARTTSEEFSSDFVDQHGYPGNPQSTATWDVRPLEIYLFCSKTLPAVIEYDKYQRKYRVAIPFDNEGVPWGATEGAANLYDHACNQGRAGTYAINPAYAEAEITLDVPEDILSFK